MTTQAQQRGTIEERLTALAGAATPGPREVTSCTDKDGDGWPIEGLQVHPVKAFHLGFWSSNISAADAAYFAALDPATVKLLAAVVAAAREWFEPSTPRRREKTLDRLGHAFDELDAHAASAR